MNAAGALMVLALAGLIAWMGSDLPGHGFAAFVFLFLAIGVILYANSKLPPKR